MLAMQRWRHRIAKEKNKDRDFDLALMTIRMLAASFRSAYFDLAHDLCLNSLQLFGIMRLFFDLTETGRGRCDDWNLRQSE